MKREIDIPSECTVCGFKNFRIGGLVYREPINRYHLVVRCMRCGTMASEELEVADG